MNAEYANLEIDLSIIDNDTVFVSYSRKNWDEIELIQHVLEKNGHKTWVDKTRIRSSEPWFNAIVEAIDRCSVFLLAISQDSLSSKVCMREVQYAHKVRKKIVPVVIRDFDENSIPKSHKPTFNIIKRLNFIYVRDRSEFKQGMIQIIRAIQTDFEHLRQHTEFLRSARLWEKHNKQRSFLLRGQALINAENWLTEIGDKRPPASPLQIDFIQQSRKAHSKARSRLLGTLVTCLLVMTALAIVAWFKEREAKSQRSIAEVARKEAESAREEEILARKRAFSLHLASQAQLESKRGTEFLPRAVCLAIESARLEPSAVATEILRQGASVLARPIHRLPHRGSISHMQFSPDGSTLITLATDSIRAWDVASGRELLRIPAIVRHTVVTQEGKRVAVAGVNGWGLWAGIKGHCIYAANFKSAARHVTISQDTNLVACINIDQKLQILDSGTGKRIVEMPFNSAASGFAFADKTLLVANGSNIDFIDAFRGVKTNSLELTSRIDELQVSQNQLFAAAFCGLEVFLIDVKDMKVVSNFKAKGAFTKRVHDLAFDQNSDMLAVGTDLEVRVLSTSNGRTALVIDHPAEQVAIDSESNLLGSSNQGRLSLWSLKTGNSVNSNEWIGRIDSKLHREPPLSDMIYQSGWTSKLQFGPEASYLLGLSADIAAIKWPVGNSSDGGNVTTMVRDVAFDPKRRFLAEIMSATTILSKVRPSVLNADEQKWNGFRHHIRFRLGLSIIKVTDQTIQTQEMFPRGSLPPYPGNPGITKSNFAVPKTLWEPEHRYRPDKRKFSVHSFRDRPKDDDGDSDSATRQTQRYYYSKDGGAWWVHERQNASYALRLGSETDISSIHIFDDRFAIVTDDSTSVKIWDLQKRDAVWSVHDAIAHKANAAPGARRFATGTVEGDAWIWELPDTEELVVLNEDANSYRQYPWRLEDITGWNKPSGPVGKEHIQAFEGQKAIVERMIDSLRFSQEGRFLTAFSYQGGGYEIQNFGGSQRVLFRNARLDPILKWSTSDWSERSSGGRWEGHLGQWCDEQGITNKSGNKYPYPVPSIRLKSQYEFARISTRVFASQGDRLLITRNSTELKGDKSEGTSLLNVIDTSSGMSLLEFEVQELGSEFVRAVRATDDNLRYALIGGNEGGIWDLKTGERMFSSKVWYGSMARDHSFFVVSTGTATEIRSLPSMDIIRSFPRSFSSEICPNGRWIALYHAVGMSLENGLLIFVNRTRPDYRWEVPLEHKIQTVAFHPTEPFVAVAEGTFNEMTHRALKEAWVRVYNLEKRSEATYFTIPGSSTALTFSPDGEWLASGSFYGVVRVWLWRPKTWTETAAKHLTRNLTRDEWQTFFPDTPYRKTIEELP